MVASGVCIKPHPFSVREEVVAHVARQTVIYQIFCIDDFVAERHFALLLLALSFPRQDFNEIIE